MKERLLIMNGQKIVQADRGDGWENQKVDKAAGLKAGIYNIYNAKQTDKQGHSDGLIVHADRSSVYQQVGRQFVMHSTRDFDKVPEVGGAVRITYNSQGRAMADSNSVALVKGRSR